MEWSGSLTGAANPLVGRYYIGDTISAGQIMAWAGLGGNAQVGDPVSVNDVGGGLGVNLSGALTYSTTIGSGGVLAEITHDPLGIIRGRASGTTASGGAWTIAGTNGNVLTQDTASATVLTEASVGTSEYVGGFQIGLTGVNAGHVRIIDSHSDGTSQTVDDPFDAVDSVGDTYLRCAAPFIRGMELVATSFDEWSAGAVASQDLPDTGEFVVISVWVGGHQIDGVISPNKTRNQFALIDSTTNPSVDYECAFTEHAYGNVLS
jgi:hypothetical protein